MLEYTVLYLFGAIQHHIYDGFLGNRMVQHLNSVNKHNIYVIGQIQYDLAVAKNLITDLRIQRHRTISHIDE